jgi:hypothetical protein
VSRYRKTQLTSLVLDIAGGHAAGVRTIWLQPKSRPELWSFVGPAPDFTVAAGTGQHRPVAGDQSSNGRTPVRWLTCVGSDAETGQQTSAALTATYSVQPADPPECSHSPAGLRDRRRLIGNGDVA